MKYKTEIKNDLAKIKVKFKKNTIIRGEKFDYYGYESYSPFYLYYKKDQEILLDVLGQDDKYFEILCPSEQEGEYSPGGAEGEIGFVHELKLPKRNIEWEKISD